MSLLLFTCLTVITSMLIGARSLPQGSSVELVNEEDQARAYLNELNVKLSEGCYKSTAANWNYNVNITNENRKKQEDAFVFAANQRKEAWEHITTKFKSWKNYRDVEIIRMLERSIDIGSAALSDEDLSEYNKLKTEMTEIQSTTKICAYSDENRCNLTLTPDVRDVMKDSRDEAELRHTWIEWHNKGGNPIRERYRKFTVLANKAAKLNNYVDNGAYWLSKYETPTIQEDLEELYETLKPLYVKIQTYARAKLRKVYDGVFTDDGLIPAHLLGNPFASSMSNIFSLLVPYPNKAGIDVTDEMKKQGYTPLKMFKKSEEFFVSLGLIPMPQSFWNDSMIEKPKDREVVCHASAWDFCNQNDFRIKQCTAVAMTDFITVHHEMGHIQYYLQYKDKHLAFRTGANPGFHEAVGDTLALSVQTPKHLKKVGLLNETAPIDDYETTINFLLRTALQKVVSLPFAFIMDKYRWAIFDGTVTDSNYNSYWWKLRKEYQGLKPPVPRSEENFDPGVIYHVVTHVEYSRYFVASIIQFQFHRSLCIEAGEYDPKDPSKPLHNCNIYGSKVAGAKLAAGLEMGASKPWPEVMKVMTGQEEMDASAMREYFQPLEEWLTIQNKNLNEEPGWRI